MSSRVLAELSPDGATIALYATGTPEELGPLQLKLSTLTALIKPLNGGLYLPASWPAVVQLKAELGAALQMGPRLAAYALACYSARLDAERGELSQPPPVNGMTPRTYQVSGARMIGATGHALITDEPGTGKSATTILGLRELVHRGAEVFPILVVCPGSVVTPWLEQFAAWAPEWRAVAWRGTPEKRRRLSKFAASYQVFVTSYDTCLRDASHTERRIIKGAPAEYKAPLLALGAKSLVIDECHNIKTPDARRTWAVRRIAERGARHVVALSGTPITHGPDDVWPALHCLDPVAWPARERWVDRYCQTEAKPDYGVAKTIGLAPWREPEFRAATAGQHRRIAKADVLDQLPPKVYTVREVPIAAAWRKAYDELEGAMIASLPGTDEQLSVLDTLAQMTRLIQLASSACDIEKVLEPCIDPFTGAPGEKERIVLHPKMPSWKVTELLEILEERGGAQTLVFAEHRKLIELAGAQVAKTGRRVGYITGQINGKQQTPKARTAVIDGFQAGDLDVVLATTRAGGVGITLTAASSVVFLQRPWSLPDSLQAEDRAHRLGSEVHECIDIIDVVAENTIESRIRTVLKGKADALGQLVQDPRIVAELLGGTAVNRIRKVSA